MSESKIVLIDKASVSSQMQREQRARERLEYLQKLVPAQAAPLTDEDLAIFGMFLQQNPERFHNYTTFAYMDYCYFFVAAHGKAIENELEKFT